MKGEKLFQTTRFEPLAPMTLEPRGPHADHQPSGFFLALEELCYFLDCCCNLCVQDSVTVSTWVSCCCSSNRGLLMPVFQSEVESDIWKGSLQGFLG